MLRIIRAVEHGAVEHHGASTGEEEDRSLEGAVLELEQLPQGGDEAFPSAPGGRGGWFLLHRSTRASWIGGGSGTVVALGSPRVDLGLGFSPFRFLPLAVGTHCITLALVE